VRGRPIAGAAVLLVAAIAVGCDAAPNPASAPSRPIAKVAVMADGRVTLDGAPATIDSIRASFKSLTERGGAVWYYREQAAGDAPPVSMQIMQLVVENRLPIRLSTRPDFSDAIGPDGKPIAR
jgi:hypothetical protein